MAFNLFMNLSAVHTLNGSRRSMPGKLTQSLMLLPFLGAMALAADGRPAQALSTVCTPTWSGTGPSSTINGTLTGAAPPCPATSVSATVTYGSGANAGTINNTNAITGAGTNNYAQTSPTSVDIGHPTSGTPEALTLTFTQAVTNPYLFFTYLDPNTSLTFSQAFTLLQSNNATLSGSTVSGNGGTNSVNDGFVVQMLGTYTAINFTYNNTSGLAQSVAFTAGVDYTPAPAPLPLLGAGAALGFSRRLRRRIRA